MIPSDVFSYGIVTVYCNCLCLRCKRAVLPVFLGKCQLSQLQSSSPRQKRCLLHFGKLSEQWVVCRCAVFHSRKLELCYWHAKFARQKDTKRYLWPHASHSLNSTRKTCDFARSLQESWGFFPAICRTGRGYLWMGLAQVQRDGLRICTRMWLYTPNAPCDWKIYLHSA